MPSLSVWGVTTLLLWVGTQAQVNSPYQVLSNDIAATRTDLKSLAFEFRQKFALIQEHHGAMQNRLSLLEHVDSAPSAGAGCASQCESALNAQAAHLCPKWCTGISSKPSMALAIGATAGAGNALTAETTSCIFNSIFSIIGDFPVLGPFNGGVFPGGGHSALLGFRVPVVRKASKVRASLRIGVDGVVRDSDKVRFIAASADDMSLPKLMRDLADSSFSVLHTALPDSCAQDGHIVGELLNKGLRGEQELIKVRTEGALLDIDLSKEVQYLVMQKNWQFNKMLMVMLTMVNAAGDVQNNNIIPAPEPNDPDSGGFQDGPFPAVTPSELLLKFMRPAATRASWNYVPTANYDYN
ncbi:MAG: hypothetical protein MHM6MM_002390 [Cercozoa sp. M6MM]